MTQILFKSEDGGNDLKEIPRELGILPLRELVAYPYMVLPLAVAQPSQIQLVEEAINGSHLVGLITRKDPHVANPMPWQMHEVGTVARIHRAVKDLSTTYRRLAGGARP